MIKSITQAAEQSMELIASGYLHPAYAESLSELGAPLLLPRSAGSILQRQIPTSTDFDAMGCYPLFACQNWSGLEEDLGQLGSKLISLSMVTDPFGEYDLAYLRQCFPDLVVPFKQHFVTDLSRAPDTFVHPHHRRNTRKALNELQVEKCAKPRDLLEDWTTLYSTLIERHHIRGMTTFSKECFARQLSVPGMTAFRALRDEVTVGMVLWYQQDNRAYYHLGAYSSIGYELHASFALFDYSIDYLAKHGIEWLNLGAGSGSNADAKSGLNRFKEGWSTGTRTAYLCGRIFDQTKYQEMTRIRNAGPTNYFPAYRVGEFL